MCLFNFAIDANIVSKTLLMGATNWINIFLSPVAMHRHWLVLYKRKKVKNKIILRNKF
jgi:hypothetical protein